MRILLFLLILLSAVPIASATSYAFTLENSFAQSAIVAEVQVVSSKIYVSNFFDFEEVEVECKILTLYKGPANLKSFRVRFHGKRKPSCAKALVFAFRPGNELRAFNGSSGLVGEKETRFSLGIDKLKAEVASLQSLGTAKPMDGFSEGKLGIVETLEPGTVTFSNK